MYCHEGRWAHLTLGRPGTQESITLVSTAIVGEKGEVHCASEESSELAWEKGRRIYLCTDLQYELPTWRGQTGPMC